MLPKFKVWNEQTGKVEASCQVTMDDLGMIIPSNGPFFKLLPYTGVRDKNGEEVYEGDLIRILERGKYGGTYTGKVEFVCFYGFFGIDKLEVNIEQRNEDGIDEDCLHFHHTRYGNNLPLGDMVFTDWYEFEVIGNIYENPELWEKEENEHGL